MLLTFRIKKCQKLGQTHLTKNNVLVLEFDKKGLLVQKKFYDKDEMNKIKVSSKKTSVLNKKDTFINSILISLRQKVNDPLGKRKAK